MYSLEELDRLKDIVLWVDEPQDTIIIRGSKEITLLITRKGVDLKMSERIISQEIIEINSYILREVDNSYIEWAKNLEVI